MVIEYRVIGHFNRKNRSPFLQTILNSWLAMFATIHRKEWPAEHTAKCNGNTASPSNPPKNHETSSLRIPYKNTRKNAVQDRSHQIPL